MCGGLEVPPIGTRHIPWAATIDETSYQGPGGSSGAVVACTKEKDAGSVGLVLLAGGMKISLQPGINAGGLDARDGTYRWPGAGNEGIRPWGERGLGRESCVCAV